MWCTGLSQLSNMVGGGTVKSALRGAGEGRGGGWAAAHCCTQRDTLMHGDSVLIFI